MPKRFHTVLVVIGLFLLGTGLAVAERAAEVPAETAATPGPGGPLYCPDGAACEFPWELPASARFVVVDLHGEVTLAMAAHVTRVVESLRPGDLLIIDIKTFGGRVDAAVTIRDALLSVDATSMRTIAYVHPRAISAGALIALANDLIVVAPAASMGAATPVQISEGGEMAPVEAKIVSYMRAEIRSTAEARGRRGDIAEAMVDSALVIDGLVGKGELLTLDGKQALEWGIASFEAPNLKALIDKLGYGDGTNQYEVVTVSWSSAERLASWFSSSAVSGILMSIGMLALMIGLYTGGSPIPLAIGAGCLAVFFFGHYVVHLAGFEEILLFGLGVILLLFEALLPGHIVPGILGLLLIVVSLGMGLVDLDRVPLEVQWELGWITSAIARVAGAILGASILGVVAGRFLPHTSLGKALTLEARISGRSTDKSALSHADLVASIGKTSTPLRPSGKISIDGKRYDAMAEDGYIAEGQRVKVVASKGFSLVVREAATPSDVEGEEAS